jgi:hypothetical protein
MAVQPVPGGLGVDAHLAGQLRQRPGLPGHAVGQVGRQVGEAELDDARLEALAGGVAVVSAVGWPWESAQARLVEQAADHLNGGVKFAGQLRHVHLVVAAGRQVVGKVSEAEGADALAQAALLAVDHREATRDAQTGVCWGCWWCYPCARSAGSPTTPGDFHR